MFLIIASSVAALAAAATPVHSAQVAHGATAYTANYHAQSKVTVREIEPRFANRNAVPVCRWQAELVVNRAVEAQGRAVPAFGKSVHRFAPMSGTYAGTCAGARSEIASEIARYSRAKASEATAIAQQDRAVLVSEMESVHAVQGG
ncbi:MAG: hypothetical protein PSY12_05410 [bacterium]|nr:hypothetical protein [bacterium]